MEPILDAWSGMHWFDDVDAGWPGAGMPSTYPPAGLDAAHRYDSWFDQRWGRYAWHIESAAVLRALEPVSGRRIVEVGCGTARLAALLAGHGANVIGIDLLSSRWKVGTPKRTAANTRSGSHLSAVPDAVFRAGGFGDSR